MGAAASTRNGRRKPRKEPQDQTLGASVPTIIYLDEPSCSVGGDDHDDSLFDASNADFGDLIMSGDEANTDSWWSENADFATGLPTEDDDEAILRQCKC